MSNKEQIQKLRDYAELAWASYGYFHLADKDYKPEGWWNKDRERLEQFAKQYNNPKTTEVELESIRPTYIDILNIEYNSFFDGDFSPLQAKRFFEKYDLLKHCPNTESGFSATLFQNKETKEYTLAIRGTEIKLSQAWQDIITTDGSLLLSSTPLEQYNDMLSFYNQCKAKYPAMTESKSLNIVGHSLGGALAQMLALSICDDKNKANINEVYTFNSPGARNLKPPYDLISNNRNIIYQKALQKAKELLIREKSIEQIVSNAINKIDKILNNQYLGITFDFLQRDLDYIANINYVILDTDLVYFYKTLIKNYENRYAKDDKGNNYKLSISDRIFHIESQNKTNEKHHANESIKENATQHLGKDIEGNYFILNLNFGGLDSHSITSMAKILYFYAYLYEVNESLIDTTSKEVKTEYELHKDEFLKEHNEIDTKEYRECKKALEYCNTIALAVHKILYKREAEKDPKEARENGYYEVKSPPNWLYAIIEQRVFEAQIKTKEAKFLLEKDTSNIIEAILYLQEKGVYIQILKEDVIKGLEAESLLAYLFAIQESSFFVSVDKELNPLIQDSHTATSLIGYITARTQIFCNPNRKADELLIKCYKNETLALYPRATQGMAQ
ncbi:hypothetical protein HRAG_02486 [Helicobacter bilis ATCC 43879]|uniref:Fungal lipase-type domain-containing protein n=2 Tax=Helicobacter TaxID=209 RepID=T5LPX8_9HELI|nr:Mbeg1-like protein [Helicobacter bilis]EQM94722.1 hypothetical protein HRAG_02486 [Helicobacter bilis ATCC 43879]